MYISSLQHLTLTHTARRLPPLSMWAPRNCSMNNLEQLAALLVDAVVNLDPQEFHAIAAAVARFKADDQAVYSAAMDRCPEFGTLFGAIERAVENP
jgi:hypothetical protein